MVELVRTCDNLTYFCSHFINTCWPVQVPTTPPNAPARSPASCASQSYWLLQSEAAELGRQAGSDPTSFRSYCGSCWTPDRYDGWICTSFTFGGRPGGARTVPAPPGRVGSSNGTRSMCVWGGLPLGTFPACTRGLRWLLLARCREECWSDYYLSGSLLLRSVGKHWVWPKFALNTIVIVGLSRLRTDGKNLGKMVVR